MNNTITTTNTYSSDMIPAIIFDEYGFAFIFVDTAKNECIKSEDVTVEWLDENNIEIDEYVKHCVNECNAMKDMGVTHGIVSYFSKDDETIFNFSKTINVAESFKKIF